MNTEVKRSLKIKTGIVIRTIKELHSYQLEAVKDKQRIQNLINENSSESSVKKQEEVLNETISMIPNTRTRLAQALILLENYLKNLDVDESLQSTSEWTEAQTVATQAREITA